MSFYDVFRGLFGFRRPRDPFFGGITRDEDEDDDDDAMGAEWGPSQKFDFGFSVGPSGMRFHDGLNFDQLFHEFNELFHDMGAWMRPFELPGVEPPPPAADLDSQVSSAGLETILRPSEPKSRSCFQSVSITTVTRPDGTVEERRMVQDSQGHQETTVTQWRRNQTVTTIEPGQGRDEATGLDNWEPAWFTGIWQQQGEPHTPDLRDSSLLGGFLRRWFSGR